MINLNLYNVVFFWLIAKCKGHLKFSKSLNVTAINLLLKKFLNSSCVYAKLQSPFSPVPWGHLTLISFEHPVARPI